LAHGNSTILNNTNSNITKIVINLRFNVSKIEFNYFLMNGSKVLRNLFKNDVTPNKIVKNFWSKVIFNYSI